MRQTKMIEWMENVEKAISRIMADKVYTSAEFKRERDNFHVSSDVSGARITHTNNTITQYSIRVNISFPNDLQPNNFQKQLIRF